MNQYIIVIISTLTIYCFLIAAIIITGKKELSQLSIIDLVFILLISNAVQNAMVNGDWVSLWLGMLAAATLFLANFFLKTLIFKNAWVEKIIEGQPVMLIYEGKILEPNLTRERITMNELLSTVREHGVAEVEDVSVAILETDGNISVCSYDQDDRKIMHRKPKVPRRMHRN